MAFLLIALLDLLDEDFDFNITNPKSYVYFSMDYYVISFYKLQGLETGSHVFGPSSRIFGIGA